MSDSIEELRVEVHRWKTSNDAWHTKYQTQKKRADRLDYELSLALTKQIELEQSSARREWITTRWYRIIDTAGKLWMETSNPKEVQKESARTGLPVQRLWEEVPHREWRDEVRQ